jgi:flagellar hook protein FlgE
MQGCIVGPRYPHNAITSNGTQTFTISGFTGKTESSTYNPTTTSNYSSAITIYDSLGLSHVVTIYFRKSHEEGTEQVWEWHAHLGSVDSATGEETIAKSGYLVFNTSGVLTSGGDPIPINFDFAQHQIPTDIPGNGRRIRWWFIYPVSYCIHYKLSGTGWLPTWSPYGGHSKPGGGHIRHYSNGQILDLYQIVLADFNNPGIEQGRWQPLCRDLRDRRGKDRYARRGRIRKDKPQLLRAVQCRPCIRVCQDDSCPEGFQANSRVITTTDEILQELMNLKR